MPDAPAEQLDAIIIGAGQAGGPLAGALAQAGRRVALIEREHVGGTCINVGCTPTKTMVASARVAYLARRGADYGVHTAPVRVDLARVRQRKRDIVESFRGGSERRVREAGVQLIDGEARFVGERRVAVRLCDGSERTLSAPVIVLNIGARPNDPGIPGLDTVPALTSTTIMELDAVPERLLVIGGGYVGLGFGQMFRRFGSDVTIVQRAPALLGREDPDVADAVAEFLREDGIDVRLATEPLRVARQDDGRIALTVRDASGEHTVVGTHLLVAAGRVPNTEALALDAAGVRADARGFVVVNERLETSAPGVYAVGDVTGGPAFTHIAYDDFRILRRNLLGDGGGTTAGRLLPYVMFTDPQLGRVGLSETDAVAQGHDVRVARMPMSWVARALETDEPRGFMKVVVDVTTERMLGAAVLGTEGGELMSALQLAIMGGLPYTALRDGVFAHPTFSEGFNNLFASLEPSRLAGRVPSASAAAG